MSVHRAQSDEDILKCWDVLLALRPHLHQEDFVERIRRQMEGGYRLAFVEADGKAVSAAGYRFVEYLAWGKAIYIDDLSTLPDARGKGYAGELLDWLIAEARREGCAQIHLDSGPQRHDAHRLYLNKRFRITSHHFSQEL